MGALVLRSVVGLGGSAPGVFELRSERLPRFDFRKRELLDDPKRCRPGLEALHRLIFRNDLREQGLVPTYLDRVLAGFSQIEESVQTHEEGHLLMWGHQVVSDFWRAVAIRRFGAWRQAPSRRCQCVRPGHERV